MKPRLHLIKREIGNFENPKTEVLFVVVDSDIPKSYPLNFVCVMPQSQGLVSGHSTFKNLFGEDSIPLAQKLLIKALGKERDFEIKSEIKERLKLLNPKTAVKARCRLCRNIFESKRLRGRQQEICQSCQSRAILSMY
jgi:hypothetical protein